VLRTAMKAILVAVIFGTTVIGQARSETAPSPVAPPIDAPPINAPPINALSDRDRIKNDRAKAAAEEKNSSTARPWDRDANGKRPWDVALPASSK
jgi:hypothetical protein